MSSDPKVEEIRARLAAATPGPWELGDWWHIQGATFCQCRPEWGPAVVQNMRINGTRMLAHRHRLPAPMGTNVINTEPYKDGFPRAVVITTDEYGPIDDTDGEFIANAPTDIALLLAKLDEAEQERDAARAEVERRPQCDFVNVAEERERALIAGVKETIARARRMQRTERSSVTLEAVLEGLVTLLPSTAKEEDRG